MPYLGQAIRIVRNKFNETQLIMSSKLGITHVYLSHLEIERSKPSLRLIKKIQETYGYDVYLLACLLENGKDFTIEKKSIHCTL